MTVDPLQPTLEPRMPRAGRVKRQVALVLAMIVTLAVSLSIFTYIRGHAVDAGTKGFIDRELPSIGALNELKLAVTECGSVRAMQLTGGGSRKVSSSSSAVVSTRSCWARLKRMLSS